MLVLWVRVSWLFTHLLAHPRKVAMLLHSSLEFMARKRRELASSVTALSWIPCSYAWEQCSMLAPPVLLATQAFSGHSWVSALLLYCSNF